MIYKFIRFSVVGASGVLVDFATTYVLKEWLKVNKYVANSAGFVLAATSNYLLNRIWTFESQDPHVLRQYLVFIGIAMIGLLISNLVVYFINERLRFNFYLSKLGAIGVVMFWNFFMNYFFNF